MIELQSAEKLKNSAENVLDWFRSIETKHLYKFFTFDIKKLFVIVFLKKVLDFTDAFTVISADDKFIIHQNLRKKILKKS